MEFKFEENETVEEICSKVIDFFDMDLENDNVPKILNKIGFEVKNNYLSEETSSIVYFNPLGNVPEFSNGLGIVVNKRFFDINADDNENIIVLRDAFRFFTKTEFNEASTSINIKRVYEEEITYKVAEDLLDRIKKTKQQKNKIIKLNL